LENTENSQDSRKLSTTSAVVMFWKVRQKSNFAQARIECRHGQLYTRESSGNTNSKTLECDQLQHDCPVTCLSLSSFLQPPSLCAFIPMRKNSACVIKMTFKFFFTYEKLREPQSTCNYPGVCLVRLWRGQNPSISIAGIPAKI
jgi:hypothetical protein